ncbi:MAG: cell division protein SepF [Actinobacteria bacterium]|nr:cell division protein SepF [Actinomycetota bacterium]
MVTAHDAHDDWYEDDEPYGRGAWDEDVAPRPLSLVVRPSLAFELIVPDSFDAAQTIADRLRTGTSVLVDLHGVERALAGRLTDFCSGLVYALEGGLQQVAPDVLLLTPDHVDVSGDEASAVREPGFHNRI